MCVCFWFGFLFFAGHPSPLLPSFKPKTKNTRDIKQQLGESPRHYNISSTKLKPWTKHLGWIYRKPDSSPRREVLFLTQVLGNSLIVLILEGQSSSGNSVGVRLPLPKTECSQVVLGSSWVGYRQYSYLPGITVIRWARKEGAGEMKESHLQL